MKRTISTLAGCAAALALLGSLGSDAHARTGPVQLGTAVGTWPFMSDPDPRYRATLAASYDSITAETAMKIAGPAAAARAVRLHDRRRDGRVRRAARAAGVRPHAVLVPGLHDAGLAAQRQLVTREPAVGARAAHHGRHDALPRPRGRVGRRERGSERRRHPPELPLEARDRGRLDRPGVPFRPPGRSRGKAVLQRDQGGRSQSEVRGDREPGARPARARACPSTASGCSITSPTACPPGPRSRRRSPGWATSAWTCTSASWTCRSGTWAAHSSASSRARRRSTAGWRQPATPSRPASASRPGASWTATRGASPGTESLPLPFDSEYAPKPAWKAIQEALHPAAPPPPPPPPPTESPPASPRPRPRRPPAPRPQPHGRQQRPAVTPGQAASPASAHLARAPGVDRRVARHGRRDRAACNSWRGSAVASSGVPPPTSPRVGSTPSACRSQGPPAGGCARPAARTSC